MVGQLLERRQTLVLDLSLSRRRDLNNLGQWTDPGSLNFRRPSRARGVRWFAKYSTSSKMVQKSC